MIWPMKKLGEICKINPIRSELKDLTATSLVSFIPMSAVDEHTQRITQEVERTFAEVKKGFTYFRRGDLLFAKITPCMENGKIALTDNLKHEIGFASTEFHVIRAGQNILTKLIYFLMASQGFRDIAQQKMTGSAGQKRVPKGFLENFEIPLPPLPEQKKIVAKLESQFAKIKEAKRLRAEAQEATKSLLAAELNRVFEIDQQIVWPKKKLEEICTFQSGLWIGKKSPLKSTRVIRNTNFKNNDGTLNYDNVAEIEVETKQLEDRLLKAGDIILERSGGGPDQPVGRVVYYNNKGEFSFSNFTTRIRKIGELVESRFLFHFLNYFYIKGATELLQKKTTGIRNLMFKEYKQIRLPLPPLNFQRSISKRIDGLMDKIHRIKNIQNSSNQDFSNLEQAILQRAFKNE